MKMGYKIEGKVKAIFDAQTFSSGFVKREMVVTTDGGKYPQDIVIEFLQDKSALLDDLRVGDGVSVAFDIRGREYNGRYFNNLVGWNVRSTDETRRGAPHSAVDGDSGSQAGNGSPAQQNGDQGGSEGDFDNDIPF